MTSALLTDRLPPGDDPEALVETFAEWAFEERGLSLYPAQEEALLEIATGGNVILSTPTGSGKSLVAMAAHAAALARGARTFYTAPIKALVSEKFFALIDVFGADKVGMLTGDAAVNEGAEIICCTAEILANIALRQGARADVGSVVMDEFHFYADPHRGWAWQVPLVELPQAQFLLMSATLGDTAFFRDDLTRRTGRETVEITSVERPVPLFYRYVVTPLHETITELLQTHEAPVYIVHFTQQSAVERAQSLMSVNVTSKEEKAAIAELIGSFRFTAGFGKTLSRLVRHGIGVHHAGMLPRYRRLVETLAQAGLLKVICGTDTLGVGINVPIRTVLFTALAKYDGVRTRPLKAREFHQIAGRAGRAGYDTLGTVVAEAPEHEIENARRLAKAGDDVKKRRRVVRVQAPDGFVGWSQTSFEKLQAAQPEALTSHFQVTFAMILNVISRPGDAFTAMRHLLEDNHEPRPRQRRHILRAIQIYRALLAAGIVEKLPAPDAEGRSVRVVGDLQLDFALNQPLSPFALAAFELLDRESPSYALDMVSVVEATLDDPRQVLHAQQNKAKGEAVAAMKADGIEYEERMALLEEVTYPKPLDELLSGALETYRRGAPWVEDARLSPKSVVRDMSERAMTFHEYVSHYQLARSEGLVLRYLADCYRALRQTVPSHAHTEELTDLIEWLGELVRQVDSSLLDEWAELAAGGGVADETAPPSIDAVGAAPAGVTRNARAFRVLVRNALFRRVELASLNRWDLLGELDSAAGWTADRWRSAFEPFFALHGYGGIGIGPDARGPKMIDIVEEPERWLVRQVIDDPEDDHDWAITAEVDLTASDEAGEAVVWISGFGD
ncbi:DEAD/DEAH box helicase [Pseudonocardia pini]|uniref:DEAD/DEAH box helicase n=1 Tax=Pseudonocardia pini TaxID=2758030 RepID=UPI0015F04F1D|nr:DEAD/DEAH box helicase [Pseudonocardia pini]